MQHGFYIPRSVMRKFNLIPQTHPHEHAVVPAGIIMGLYMEYCSWKLWGAGREDIFNEDDGLQYHLLDHSIELSHKQVATANKVLLELKLITLEFGAVTSVKVYRPSRGLQ